VSRVGVAELFRHSGYRVHNGEEHFGYDEVHALKTAHDKVYDDQTLRTKDVMTNTIIELDPDGVSARTRSYFTVYQATPQFPLQCVIAGRHHHALEKVDGAGQFRDRYIIGDLIGDLIRDLIRDLIGDLSQHLRGNPLEAH
jgi:hypothetical protein